MAKLFIGQRVRVVYVNHIENQRLVGKEFRIAERFRSVWVLDFEKIGDPYRGFSDDQLEPIVPDGHRAGEEGRCEPLDKLLSEVSRESV